MFIDLRAHFVKEVRFSQRIEDIYSIMEIEIDHVVEDYYSHPTKSITQTLKISLFGADKKKLIPIQHESIIEKNQKGEKKDEKFKRKKSAKTIAIFHRD